MGKKDPRVDAYIAKAPDYAKPILKHLRALVHRGCPGVEESIKWGMPSFGHQGILCGMAAFKAHCAFGFWSRELKIPEAGPRNVMGQFGRLTSPADLPSDKVMLGYVREAARLNAKRKERGPQPRRARKPIPVPKELTAALKKKPAALAKFKAFSPSQQRDYSEWITEAKTDATRERRLETSVGWIAQGKPRMWKYMRPRSDRA
jgi:uncharacterized protein YdeI (YjbR/CyaY-like superfamily)